MPTCPDLMELYAGVVSRHACRGGGRCIRGAALLGAERAQLELVLTAGGKLLPGNREERATTSLWPEVRAQLAAKRGSVGYLRQGLRLGLPGLALAARMIVRALLVHDLAAHAGRNGVPPAPHAAAQLAPVPAGFSPLCGRG
ncbi:MAG: hypothetical protein ACUVTG_15330 [Candidatus Oleimicrobiaceae bacterium]